MKNFLPIRKLVVAGVVSALTWAAMRCGLNLGSAAINQAAVAIVGFVFAYAEKDPRVREIIAEAETVLSTPDA